MHRREIGWNAQGGILNTQGTLMPGASTYRTMTDADAPDVMRLISTAFGVTKEQFDSWLAVARADRFRVMERAGEPAVSCLLLADLGQFFGGRLVGMEGVAGVAVAPEARGGGEGAAIMREAILEMHRRGVALSTLFPATQALYRRVGYEQAGYMNEIRITPSTIGASREDRALPMRPVKPEDWPRIESAHREAMTPINAAIARNSYIWERVRVWRGEPTRGWVIDVDGRIEGQISLLIRTDSADRIGRKEVFCSDVQAYTARAARRMLAFLQDLGSMVNEIAFYGGPNHPLLLLLPEQRWTRAASCELWMLRIVDVERALTERGYPQGLSARVEMEFTDELIPSNNARFTLEVEGGRGRVKRGGSGSASLAMHIRDFAPIYTALQPPIVMHRLGKVTGDAHLCESLGAIFAGGTPSITERF